MTTIHKALAEIRELRNEEIDLVGGSGYCTEVSMNLTYSIIAFCSPYGCGAVSVADDMMPDISSD